MEYKVQREQAPSHSSSYPGSILYKRTLWPVHQAPALQRATF